MSNCATKHDANSKIPHFTDHIDDGNKNAFLLHIGSNTNMSSYLCDLYEYDETENENEMKIYEALDLQMPMNMKYENMKMKTKWIQNIYVNTWILIPWKLMSGYDTKLPQKNTMVWI